MEAILPSLVSKEAPAGYKGTAMGIYSTSQFIGVAIGGSLGGWLLQLNGTGMVFLGSAVIAAVWFIISMTMQEPPYVSSLRIQLPDSAQQEGMALEHRLKAQPGVADVVIVFEEAAAYIKVDTKLSTRRDLEQVVTMA